MTAVEVTSGYMFYGKENDPKKNVILNHLNMNVPRGSIYGLLGASGCGKTTLLSCIVGQRKLKSGSINVLGSSPGVPGSGIPGNRVGYMPQDIALTAEMTIKEILFYFGRIYDMTEQRIEERYRQLKDLMEFPMDDDRLVGQCSGGQQRRISFACAMVHEPELLILDEPTVGLDPLLREKIWDFLVDTTRNSKLAVIITTHYIEEARQANMIGMMRNGVLLAENTPQSILSSFNTLNLEDAFLEMCQKQGELNEPTQPLSTLSIQSLSRSTMDAPISITHSTPAEDKFREAEGDKKSEERFVEVKPKRRSPNTSTRRMKALLFKNTMQVLRNRMGMIFMIVFPILQLSCFYFAVGGHPKDLKLGVVNSEVTNFQECHNDSLVTTFVHDYECDLHRISCRFVNGINTTIAHKLYYDSQEEAYAAARNGDIIGYIYFAPNFSASVEDVLVNGRKSSNESIDDREIQIHLDMTNQQLTYYLERKLRELYIEFSTDLMTDCEYQMKLGSGPVNLEKPIYGTLNQEFRDFAAPGVILTMLFFLASLVTSTVFISDRIDGIWERTLIAGVSTTELLTAHVIIHTIISVVQCLEVVIFVALFLSPQGDKASLVFLLLLVSFSGLQFGLMISIFCNSHTMANFVATGTFYPMVIFCGLLWPVEGMPKILQMVSRVFPFTVPSKSMRNIIQRGWHINNSQVYDGFLVICGWIVFFALFSLFGLRRNK